jgi:hypothetical protein
VAEVRHSDDQVTSLYVGGMTRAELLDALAGAGVRLNEHAQTLLEGPAFEPSSADALEVAVRSVGELGLADGSVFADILDAAGGHGLAPCPPDTGPYLRLMVDDQASAPDHFASHASWGLARAITIAPGNGSVWPRRSLATAKAPAPEAISSATTTSGSSRQATRMPSIPFPASRYSQCSPVRRSALRSATRRWSRRSPSAEITSAFTASFYPGAPAARPGLRPTTPATPPR